MRYERRWSYAKKYYSSMFFFGNTSHYTSLDDTLIKEYIDNNNLQELSSKNIGCYTVVLSEKQKKIIINLITVDNDGKVKKLENSSSSRNPYITIGVKETFPVVGGGLSYAYMVFEDETFLKKADKISLVFENKELTTSINSKAMILPLQKEKNLINYIVYDKNGVEIFNRDKRKGFV